LGSCKDLGRTKDGVDVDPDRDADALAKGDVDVDAKGDVDVDAEGDADVDAEAEATTSVGVLVGPSAGTEPRQPSILWFAPSLGRVEAMLTGRPVELEAVGVRAEIGWGRSITPNDGSGGATGPAGRRGSAGAGASLRGGRGVRTGGITGVATGARFAGTGTGTGTARRAGGSRRAPSCASTLSSATANNRCSSHC